MYSSRQLNILMTLKNEESWVLGSYLASTLKVSVRTIQNEIRDINNNNNKRFIIVESNTRLGYRLAGDSETLNSMLNGIQLENIELESKYNRAKQIIMILMFYNRNCTLEELSEKLFLSRSSISSILRQTKRIISRTPNLEFITTYGKGYRISGNEDAKRNMIVKTLDGTTDYSKLINNPRILTLDQQYKELYPQIASLFTKHNYMLSGESLSYLVKYIIVSVFRSKEGFTIESQNSMSKTSHILLVDLVRLIKQYLMYDLDANEVHNIIEKIEEMSIIVQKYHKAIIDEEVINYWKTFSSNIELKFDFKFMDHALTIERFNHHVKRMLMRVNSGRTMIGSYTKELANTYPLVWFFLKSTLEESLGIKVPDAELGYLIGYVNGLIEMNTLRLNAVCISNEDPALLHQLKLKLENLLSLEIESVDIMPKYYYRDKLNDFNYDLVFTTDVTDESSHLIYVDILGELKDIRQIQTKVKEVYKNKMKLANKRYTMLNRNIIKLEKVDEEDMLQILSTPHNSIAINDYNYEVLYVFEMKKGKKHQFTEYQLQKPIVYNRKSFKKIYYIQATFVDVIQYFNYIRTEIIQNGQ